MVMIFEIHSLTLISQSSKCLMSPYQYTLYNRNWIQEFQQRNVFIKWYFSTQNACPLNNKKHTGTVNVWNFVLMYKVNKFYTFMN